MSHNSSSSVSCSADESNLSKSLAQPLIKHNGKNMTLAEAEALVDTDLNDTQAQLVVINKLHNVVTAQYTSYEDLVKLRNYPIAHKSQVDKNDD